MPLTWAQLELFGDNVPKHYALEVRLNCCFGEKSAVTLKDRDKEYRLVRVPPTLYEELVTNFMTTPIPTGGVILHWKNPVFRRHVVSDGTSSVTMILDQDLPNIRVRRETAVPQSFLEQYAKEEQIAEMNRHGRLAVYSSEEEEEEEKDEEEKEKKPSPPTVATNSSMEQNTWKKEKPSVHATRNLLSSQTASFPTENENNGNNSNRMNDLFETFGSISFWSRSLATLAIFVTVFARK